MTSSIKVRKHSGKSVFIYRVYRVINTPVVHNIQLAKYRTLEEAERAAEHYRSRDAKMAAERMVAVTYEVR